MAKSFIARGKWFSGALGALTAALLLVTACDPGVKAPNDPVSGQNTTLPVAGGGQVAVAQPIVVDAPVAAPAEPWDTIDLLVRSDPADPHNERFLDDWHFILRNITDEDLSSTPAFYGEAGLGGGATVGLPAYMFSLPLVITAYNDALPLVCDPILTPGSAQVDEDTGCECRQFEIFVPAYCHDKAVWLLGPFESALWDFYEEAAQREAEAWNPSQVDCGTWLANLQLLILTDEVADALHELSDSETMLFEPLALVEALQENQHLLVPTRPPICMAERRHNGGGMERSDRILGATTTIDDFVAPFGPSEVVPDSDPIVIDNLSGLPNSICGVTPWDATAERLTVNAANFLASDTFQLDEQDFPGTVHDQVGIQAALDVSVYNVRLGNGREFDHDKYDDACALTTIVQFTNTDDDEQDVLTNSGVTFPNLFGAVLNTSVHLTSDGDNVVDDNDYWAIFFQSGAVAGNERVLAVELLGHRQEDFRDVLHITFNEANDDLFLGLRADYELNEEEVDGERAFLAYTLSVWDGSSLAGRRAVRENIANCYEASDVWARQFFVTEDFANRADECCLTDECEIDSFISPLLAAEFAVRSQCFSNSRANQRWRTDDSGYWSMNTEHGVHGNIIINPGWLAPNLDFEIYIQKFDEAVFKGPRTVRRTDSVGQLMAEIPTLVEGDRVLIKAEDNCCDDYDLVLPCVPEFTGFAGAPGIPFVPATFGPPPPPAPIPPIGVPGPGQPFAGIPAGPVAQPIISSGAANAGAANAGAAAAGNSGSASASAAGSAGSAS